jgi:hypothetical protein
MEGLPAVLVGVLWYALAYLRPLTWPTARFARLSLPMNLNRVFRVDGGELLLSALILQLWAVALIVTGLLVIGHVVPAALAPSVELAVAEYGILIVGGVWLLIIVIGRTRS